MYTHNSCILIGRVGRDAESRQAGSGEVTSFSVCTNRRVKKGEAWEDVPEWHNIIAWNIPKMAGLIVKGADVTVMGRMQSRSYDKNGETKYVSEIVVNGYEGLKVNNSGARSTGNANASTDEDAPF